MQFFPDVNDMDLAKNSMFEGTSFKLDFLTKPSGLEDFGFGKKTRMTDRAQSGDKIFLVAYPYFNVNGTFIPSASVTSLLSVSTLKHLAYGNAMLPECWPTSLVIHAHPWRECGSLSLPCSMRFTVTNVLFVLFSTQPGGYNNTLFTYLRFCRVYLFIFHGCCSCL